MPEKAIKSIMKNYGVSHKEAEGIWARIENKRKGNAKKKRKK